MGRRSLQEVSREEQTVSCYHILVISCVLRRARLLPASCHPHLYKCSILRQSSPSNLWWTPSKFLWPLYTCPWWCIWRHIFQQQHLGCLGGSQFDLLALLAWCTYLKRKVRNKYQRNRKDHDRVLLVICLTFEPIIGTINISLHQLLGLSIADKDSNILPWCGSPVWIVIAFFRDLHAPYGTLTILPRVNW